ncbi:MAG: hypothetical protein E6G90_16885 [Alphaproteobacteria bacterium]|nr:MAG: hypothetical protein E6G90_16885 [Alphaproteobacteria bacterium]
MADTRLTLATDTAEREAALDMLAAVPAITGSRSAPTAPFVADRCRSLPRGEIPVSGLIKSERFSIAAVPR